MMTTDSSHGVDPDRTEHPGTPPGQAESTARRILRLTGWVLSLPLIGLIRFYQLVISPLTPPTCRYYPSCSSYALTALQRFGPLKGTWLAVRRVARCHPWAAGGLHYVPERTHTPAGPDQTSARASGPPDHDH